ncbi:glycosyltransferase involved in cell wall biosynthesis [Allocatelliglobosispora scoriae]|uniref:Glycosyltransferase involved in cell wall biosynthesis n=1 Tax=Allocatelliglobosispora scoriae TaxID=643052 RepID=A0A841BUG7_9ACTN|nr:glycosyltransferase family 2 protein [Allocatelliglobosispora scoriae]MBB5872757.1 glycosyltransferase involved in cell wall biosynthesis [Allocatelliglobosispora scoriae]
MSWTPDVSVVIPTFARPDLVTRAVHSALAQTLERIEVIVVIDGPDEATRDALAAIPDPRLRVIELATQAGAPHARNVGVTAARALWTALLDDDDEWLPTKLAVQRRVADEVEIALPIVASRLLNRTPRAEFVMPRRIPAPGEPLSEYLTVRKGLFHGEGFIQTSTIMAPTELLRRVPFTVGLRRMQELDWTIRALNQPGVDLVFADEPLVIWHTDENRPRISTGVKWEPQLEWLRRSRPLLTPRSYAAIAMSSLSSIAAPTRSRRAFWLILGEARRHGKPSAIDYLTFLQIWLVPQSLRRGLRDLILGRRDAGQVATAYTPPVEPPLSRIGEDVRR